MAKNGSLHKAYMFCFAPVQVVQQWNIVESECISKKPVKQDWYTHWTCQKQCPLYLLNCSKVQVFGASTLFKTVIFITKVSPSWTERRIHLGSCFHNLWHWTCRGKHETTKLFHFKLFIPVGKTCTFFSRCHCQRMFNYFSNSEPRFISSLRNPHCAESHLKTRKSPRTSSLCDYLEDSSFGKMLATLYMQGTVATSFFFVKAKLKDL